MFEQNPATLLLAVLGRMSDCQDERFKEVMTSLVTHLHGFIHSVKLTEQEWFAAIRFLTETGQACSDKRQEFILLSDTLGASMAVIMENQDRVEGSLEATVEGPYYWQGAPEVENGADIAQGVKGEPTYYTGRLIDMAGRPVAGGLLDIWSGDGDGNYDMQLPGETGMRARARLRADAEGRYAFWSIRPSYYPVPTDGPVGRMLLKMGRHPNRPGHVHFKVSAPGCQSVTTHLFVADSPYLDSDAVFGVRDSLVIDFERHAPGTAPDGRRMDVPYCTAHYDFRLAPAA